MVLTQQQLLSLVEGKTRSPHDLLGLHTLGYGSGLVARALVPDAASVEIQPVHEKDKPTIKLARISKTDVFEGTSTEAERVYAYDLVVTDKSGATRRTRDPYSFLPTLGESDFTFLAKAMSAAFTINWGRNCELSMAPPASASPFGPPTPNGSASWATLIIGMDAAIRCVRSAPPGFGKSLSPTWVKAPCTNTKSGTGTEKSD